MIRALSYIFALLLTTSVACAEAQRTLSAKDSLAPSPGSTEDVRSCIEGLVWTPAEFKVTVEAATADAEYQSVLRFPSPVNTNDPLNDLVSVLWYRPKESSTTPRPAMVVVHESGSSMPVGKLFCRHFASHGIESFLVQLPHYGLRRKPGHRPTGDQFLLAMRQGIADVRRARDAVACLPEVDPSMICLQGTSLGGFVAGTTAGLDRGFARVFIMVAGGDLYGLMQNGQKEAVELRDRLATAGYSGDRLKELMWKVEPNRLADRLDPETTWLYSASQDQVVPMANALAFKKAAKLSDDHHVRMPGDHVTTIVFLPAVIQQIVQQVPRPESGTAASNKQ